MSPYSFGGGIFWDNAGPEASAPNPNAPNAATVNRLKMARPPLFIAKMGDQCHFAQGCGNVSSPND